MVNARKVRPSLLLGVLPAAATVLVALFYGIAGVLASARIREIAWLDALPSADAAAPRSTPARYSGTLHAPPGRKTFSGTPAAAFWWSVAYDDDDSHHTFCQGRERSALSLETTTGVLRVEWTEADPSIVGLVSDDRDSEYDLPLAIDLGSRAVVVTATLPSGTCWGQDAKYAETTIPDGANVEIAGCVADGAIRACEGALHGVLAVPVVAVDRRHRFEQALYVFRFAFFAAFGALFSVGIALIVQMRRAARAVRPGRGP